MILYQYFLLGENDRQFTNFLKLNMPSKTNIESSTSDCQQKLTWLDNFRKKKEEIFTLASNNLKSG